MVRRGRPFHSRLLSRRRRGSLATVARGPILRRGARRRRVLPDSRGQRPSVPRVASALKQAVHGALVQEGSLSQRPRCGVIAGARPAPRAHRGLCRAGRAGHDAASDHVLTPIARSTMGRDRDAETRRRNAGAAAVRASLLAARPSAPCVRDDAADRRGLGREPTPPRLVGDADAARGGRASRECRQILARDGSAGVVERLAWLGRPAPLTALWHTSWEDDPLAGGGYWRAHRISTRLCVTGCAAPPAAWRLPASTPAPAGKGF